MKPENILQTDLLDIIFLNRNKEYGAYTLRKHYDSRLLKSFALTFLFACIFAFANYVKSNFFKQKVSIGAGVPVHEFEIIKPAKNEKKKEVAKEIKKAPKPHAQKAYVVPKIVKDGQADKNVPEVKELDDKIISNIDKDGTGVNADELQTPVEEPTEGSGKASDVPATPVEPPAPLHHAEVMPEFPGGMEAFKKFMLRHLRQPDLNEGDKVVVKVHFVVDADGSIKSMNVIQSGGQLDAEVLRVVAKMPKWKPGIQNGRNVPVYFTLPVTFLGPEM